MVDNLRACQAKFDPATFVFPDTGQPLQCTAAKTSTCLSPAQINAVKIIHQGPRNSIGERIKAPAGAAVRDFADNTVFGYAYDGGFMAPTGIPAGKIGTPTTTPVDYTLGLRSFSYGWLNPPDPGFNPLNFDFDKDMGRLNNNTPRVSYSISTDITKFRDRGGKIIWFHGAIPSPRLRAPSRILTRSRPTAAPRKPRNSPGFTSFRTWDTVAADRGPISSTC